MFKTVFFSLSMLLFIACDDNHTSQSVMKDDSLSQIKNTEDSNTLLTNDNITDDLPKKEELSSQTLPSLDLFRQTQIDMPPQMFPEDTDEIQTEIKQTEIKQTEINSINGTLTNKEELQPSELETDPEPTTSLQTPTSPNRFITVTNNVKGQNETQEEKIADEDLSLNDMTKENSISDKSSAMLPHTVQVRFQDKTQENEIVPTVIRRVETKNIKDKQPMGFSYENQREVTFIISSAASFLDKQVLFYENNISVSTPVGTMEKLENLIVSTVFDTQGNLTFKHTFGNHITNIWLVVPFYGIKMQIPIIDNHIYLTIQQGE